MLFVCFARFRNRAVFAVFLLSACPLLSATTLRLITQTKINSTFSAQLRPVWIEGALVGVEGNKTALPVVVSLDSTGGKLPPVAVTVPESKLIDVRSVSRGADGTVGACGVAYDRAGHGAEFIQIVHEPGAPILIRTNPFAPYRVAIAKDGSVWGFGPELVNGAEPEKGISEDYASFRHYDRTGRLIGSLLPRSRFAVPLVMLTSGRISTGDGRIGLLSGPVSGPSSEYFELDAHGNLGSFSPALADGESVTGMALLNQGVTVLSVRNIKTHTIQLIEKDAGSGVWRTIQTETLPGIAGRQIEYLAGSQNGRELVFQRTNSLTFWERVQ